MTDPGAEMRASTFEFRQRGLILTLMAIIGF